MINFLKTNWKTGVTILLIAVVLTDFYLNRNPTRAVTAISAVDPTPQLNKLAGQIDSAITVLNKQDKVLKETLAKLKGVEWQLALATKLQVERYDSLSAAFGREAARPNYDRELLELLGQ